MISPPTPGRSPEDKAWNRQALKSICAELRQRLKFAKESVKGRPAVVARAKDALKALRCPLTLRGVARFFADRRCECCGRRLPLGAAAKQVGLMAVLRDQAERRSCSRECAGYLHAAAQQGVSPSQLRKAAEEEQTRARAIRDAEFAELRKKGAVFCTRDDDPYPFQDRPFKYD